MGKRGRRPKYDNVWCPHQDCELFGRLSQGNIVSNGTYQSQSGPIRYFICRCCGRTFNERANTIFYDLRTSEAKVLHALAMLAKGMTLRGTAEVLGSKLDTVRRWLAIAAEHAQEVNKHLMKKFRVTKAELDELWTLVKKNDLRRRAILKRAQGGLGSVLPPSIGF